MRTDGRSKEQLREIRITRHYTIYAEGSVLVEFGNTKVLCNASVEDKAPPFKVGTGEGFVTAEYAMLPRSVQTRIPREINKLKKDGRASEIQRLVGRSLRGAVDMKLLGERLVVIDCDVIQADGGTRTAAVTGGFVALHDACSWLLDQGMISKMPILDFVAAVSVGIKDGEVLLDLCYEEDSTMDVDMNVVMTGQGGLVEIQGTAEGRPFSKKQLDAMLRLAGKGIDGLIRIQKESLGIPL